jgi:DNA-3-methyladenine glycosylase II
MLTLTDVQLRGAGLSRQKIGYLRDLSAKVVSGALPLDEVDRMNDDELIAHLVQVKGIGRWTAQMFLMFRLGRRNVLPELDLGIQNAIRRAYGKRKRPSPKQVRAIGAKWSPHSTVASWYLWRSLENGDGQGAT